MVVYRCWFLLLRVVCFLVEVCLGSRVLRLFVFVVLMWLCVFVIF